MLSSQRIDELKDKEELSTEVELRQNNYLNNRIEQDHRFIQRLVKLGMGFGSFKRRTLKGGNHQRVKQRTSLKKKEPSNEQVKFIAEIFGVTA